MAKAYILLRNVIGLGNAGEVVELSDEQAASQLLRTRIRAQEQPTTLVTSVKPKPKAAPKKQTTAPKEAEK